MLETLKEEVCAANLELVRRGVVIYTWGNVSGIDRAAGIMVIKPSGVPYEGMTAADMVCVDLETGRTAEGKWRPSSDTATHLALYRETRSLTKSEADGDYEANTGRVIIEALRERSGDVLAVPAVIVRNHGPFTWGKDPAEAVYHAVVLETVADMAQRTIALDPAARMPQYLLDRHYFRKHGPNAYYGQK